MKFRYQIRTNAHIYVKTQKEKKPRCKREGSTIIRRKLQWW